MKFVHEQIKSESYDDFKARQSRVRKLRNFILILDVAL
jgi:cell division protein FtsL